MENLGSIRNPGYDMNDRISKAINHLLSIVRWSVGLIDDNVLDDNEREETIEWIDELDGILSDFRIGGNLIQLLKGNYSGSNENDDDDDDGSDNEDGS
jgi:hypothetical protein